jgi:hypothetical protein
MRAPHYAKASHEASSGHEHEASTQVRNFKQYRHQHRIRHEPKQLRIKVFCARYPQLETGQAGLPCPSPKDAGSRQWLMVHSREVWS